MKRAGKRGYLSVQAAGEGELATAFDRAASGCPVGVSGPPSGLPTRSPEEWTERAAAIRPAGSRLAAALKACMGDQFPLWLADCRLVDITPRGVFLAAPSILAGGLRSVFAPRIERAASEMAGEPLSLGVWTLRASSPAWVFSAPTLAELLEEAAA